MILKPMSFRSDNRPTCTGMGGRFGPDYPADVTGIRITTAMQFRKEDSNNYNRNKGGAERV